MSNFNSEDWTELFDEFKQEDPEQYQKLLEWFLDRIQKELGK